MKCKCGREMEYLLVGGEKVWYCPVWDCEAAGLAKGIGH